MKSKDGMTIVELIVSIVLVSVVMILFLNLFITVQGYSIQNQNESDLLINQAVLVKAIEKDINEYKLVGVSTCSSDIFDVKKYQVIPTGASNVYCLKLTLSDALLDDNIGYIVEYTYTYRDGTTKNVVGYKRGMNQTIREIGYITNPGADVGIVKSSCSSVVNENCALNIMVPMYNEEGDDYSINVAYIYKYSELTYSPGIDYGFTID